MLFYFYLLPLIICSTNDHKLQDLLLANIGHIDMCDVHAIADADTTEIAQIPRFELTAVMLNGINMNTRYVKYLDRCSFREMGKGNFSLKIIVPETVKTVVGIGIHIDLFNRFQEQGITLYGFVTGS